MNDSDESSSSWSDPIMGDRAPPRLTQGKVGITIDGTDPRRYTNPKTGDVTETYNFNEPVFQRLTLRKPGMELVDSLGRHIPLDLIRFDPEYEDPEARLFMTEEMQDRAKLWHQQNNAERASRMRDWRISQRTWEADLIPEEFEKGNLGHFSPQNIQRRHRGGGESAQTGQCLR